MQLWFDFGHDQVTCSSLNERTDFFVKICLRHTTVSHKFL
uniref:Uncharacterized protein n=1 Tax=Arundo donax TaxID=35708 RepID=A0A0A9BDP0_ARUDO